MKILYVAYPLLPVTPESCGGAEQLLLTLEREMLSRGHETTLAACAGSAPSGKLLVTSPGSRCPDDFDQVNRAHIESVIQAAQGGTWDLIHDHSGSFWPHAAGCDVPVLATRHLPRNFYPLETFSEVPVNVSLNCVSFSQARSFSDLGRFPVIPNGIAMEAFAFSRQKQNYLLWLGRICEEKAPHLALDVAAELRRKTVLAGDVYPFSYHQAYFDREVTPRLQALGDQACWIQKPSWQEKLQLLSRASAVLITSVAEETSSLVAMEAMACGTAVVAFRRGALPEIVENQQTGYLVEDVPQMIDAIRHVGQIDPQACRDHVQRTFSACRMADEYERLYRQIVSRKEQMLPVAA